MKKIYRFKGAIFSAKKAQIYGERIDEISNNGRVTTHDLVEDARNPKSPLHDIFEWNDSEAASKYRLQQARQLLRTIEVEIVSKDKKPKWVNAHISFKEEEGYVSTIDVMSDKDLRERFINQALSEARRWMERYKAYQELTDIFKAIKITSKKIK